VAMSRRVSPARLFSCAASQAAARATRTQEHENAPGARDRERVPGTGPAVRYNADYWYLVMNRSERADLISGTVPIE
jgi:hypothetical protein